MWRMLSGGRNMWRKVSGMNGKGLDGLRKLSMRSSVEGYEAGSGPLVKRTLARMEGLKVASSETSGSLLSSVLVHTLSGRAVHLGELARQAKASLLLVSFGRCQPGIGRWSQWRSPMGDHPDLRVYHVLVNHSIVHRLVAGPMFQREVRRRWPEARHDDWLVHNGRWIVDEAEEHAVLMDDAAKIRWVGAGDAGPEKLLECTSKILQLTSDHVHFFTSVCYGRTYALSDSRS
eukprot:CAMPEP_0184689508 /NCGR_PEP_ID=MMETSP0312-20130426/30695_1 /TAXON_ID=31354 /ORGANISM="Compsopogon coeruleus, Strain SAG 36.94" /LENGTH=231 /DNA_ID=CAMNT_0027146865 /DNA_START=133 /DNA_END=828 /DNA_ORIENTATION=+